MTYPKVTDAMLIAIVSHSKNMAQSDAPDEHAFIGSSLQELLEARDILRKIDAAAMPGFDHVLMHNLKFDGGK